MLSHSLRAMLSRHGLTACLVTIVLVIFALVLPGCADDEAGGNTTVGGVTSSPSGIISTPDDTISPSGEVTSTPSDATTSSVAGTEQIEIRIVDMRFEPPEATIQAGGAVRWLNIDSISHTVVADDGSFNSGMIAEAQIFVHTFTEPGRYSYHCSIHPADMKGVIIVE